MSAYSAEAAPAAGPTMGQKVAAEVIGTFVLVLFGVGAALISRGDYVATGLSFGIAVLVMAYAFGRVSGGHFNPAVSLGAAVGGRIAWREAFAYMGAQLAGAVLAGLALFTLLHGFDGFDSTGAMGQNSFGDAGSGFAWWAALILELLMTAVFVTVILAVTDVRNEHPALAPLAIGLALTAIHFASMGATGTSVNPARSIGPALFAGSDAILQLWLFILAPLLGALIAGAVYHPLFGRVDEPVPGSGLRMSRPAVPQPAYPHDAYQQQWNQQYPQQYAAPQGQPYAPGWNDPQAQQQAQQQGWQGQHVAQPQAWEGESWEGRPAQGDPQHDPQTWQGQTPQSATQQPWTPDVAPPAPNEPYWSQQLPENWNDTDGGEGGQTQIRPPER